MPTDYLRAAAAAAIRRKPSKLLATKSSMWDQMWVQKFFNRKLAVKNGAILPNHGAQGRHTRLNDFNNLAGSGTLYFPTVFLGFLATLSHRFWAIDRGPAQSLEQNSEVCRPYPSCFNGSEVDNLPVETSDHNRTTIGTIT